MEKYGFVYLWFDKKHKRFYIGCRWGNENDGYICSSSWMKNSYKRRTQDFKRKILTKVYTNKKDLLQEEHRWLSMIKKEELGKRYYNLHNHHFGHWTTDENKKLTISEKISNANKNDPRRSEWMKNRTISEETKEKLRQVNLGKKQSEETKKRRSESLKGHDRYKDPIFREKMSIAARNRSSETRQKISDNSKRLHKEGRIGRKKKT